MVVSPLVSAKVNTSAGTVINSGGEIQLKTVSDSLVQLGVAVLSEITVLIVEPIDALLLPADALNVPTVDVCTPGDPATPQRRLIAGFELTE